MTEFIDLVLKPDVLERYGLPSIAYPIPLQELSGILADGGNLPFALMLDQLQRRSECWADWRDLEEAMDRLAIILAPDDDRAVVSAAGEDWWLEIGPVDLNARIVTILRENDLIAAIAPTVNGRLRVATYRPVDEGSASRLIALGQTPHAVHGVAMRETNWEFALDSAAGMGQVYARDRGESYLSYSESGAGIFREGAEIAEWRVHKDLVARRPAVTAVELGVHFAYSDEPGV